MFVPNYIGKYEKKKKMNTAEAEKLIKNAE